MKSLSLAAVFLGALLAFSFTVPAVGAQTSTIALVNNFAQSSHRPNTLFIANATSIRNNGTVAFNYLGLGGNDTFQLEGGNQSANFVASDLGNSTMNILSGNPIVGLNQTVFSLVSGANSTFNIIQNNFNGSVVFVIVGGATSVVNATSVGPIGPTVYSINLGFNSTATVSSQFSSNETSINIVT